MGLSSCFVGSWVFFFILFGSGGGGFLFLFLRGLIFCRGFGFEVINISSTFTLSVRQFLLCTVAKCKCWMVCFFVLG